jgi:hypothetical protein
MLVRGGDFAFALVPSSTLAVSVGPASDAASVEAASGGSLISVAVPSMVGAGRLPGVLSPKPVISLRH